MKLFSIRAICCICSTMFADVVTADPIRIGAWNIEHFGREGDTTDPLDVAKYIIDSNVAILSLEEIYDTDNDPAKRTNNKLDAALQHILSATGATWTYVLFAKSSHEAASEQAKQLTGIAWNTSLATLIGEPLKIEVSHGAARPDDYWRRQPFAIQLRLGAGKTDVVAIPVHMRSNSRGDDQSVAAPELRRREIETLLSRFAMVRSHFDDEDVIILGDTNVLSASEPAVMLLTGSGFRDLNATDKKTYMSQGDLRSPFDRFFVPSDQPEFSESVQRRMLALPDGMDREQFNDRVSDHVMIVMTIDVRDDDD